MADPGERLRATLSELHAELESLQRVDPEVRALLETTIHDIHRAMAAPANRPPPSPDEHASLAERLSEAATRFEGQHPTLSGAVGSVIDALGQMGI